MSSPIGHPNANNCPQGMASCPNGIGCYDPNVDYVQNPCANVGSVRARDMHKKTHYFPFIVGAIGLYLLLSND